MSASMIERFQSPKTAFKKTLKSVRMEFKETAQATKYVLTKTFYPNSILPEIKQPSLRTAINELARQLSSNISTGEKILFLGEGSSGKMAKLSLAIRY